MSNPGQIGERKLRVLALLSSGKTYTTEEVRAGIIEDYHCTYAALRQLHSEGKVQKSKMLAGKTLKWRLPRG